MKFRILIIGFLLLSISACHKTQDTSVQYDLTQISQSDTLRVVVRHSPFSYFIYKGQELGYDYELCQDLAAYLNVNLKIIQASDETEVLEILESGQADLAACNCTMTKDINSQYYFLKTHDENGMVLVQRKGRNAIAKVTDLENRKVYIARNSVFHNRLQALNDEIGGGIRIVLAADSTSIDSLIEQVEDGTIDYTLAYQDIASVYYNYNKQLDVRLPVAFPQSKGWVMRRNTPDFNAAVTEWWQQTDAKSIAKLKSIYFNNNLYISSHRKVLLSKGSISPYDAYFKMYAPEIGWDWRLLTALVYHESRFDSTIVSYAGAMGLMQLMPVTALRYGLDSTNVFNPEKNIAAGVQYIKYLQRVYRHVEDKEEQQKFILASYNAGPAHILDAMALAKKYGKHPDIWYDNVEYYLMKKSEPEYYNDEVVKYGLFRGGQTRRYVQSVFETYQNYIRLSSK